MALGEGPFLPSTAQSSDPSFEAAQAPLGRVNTSLAPVASYVIGTNPCCCRTRLIQSPMAG